MMTPKYHFEKTLYIPGVVLDSLCPVLLLPQSGYIRDLCVRILDDIL